MKKSVLLIVDVQNDYFEGGKFPLAGMAAAAKVAADVLKFFRETNQPVVHIQHIEEDQSAPFFSPDTPGVEIHSLVQPASGEVLIQKRFPNSFRNTELLAKLKEFGADQLVICGAMSNMCIDATTRAAFDLGFECTVVHDACAASTIEFEGTEVGAKDVHRAFMGALASVYGAVVSFDEYMRAARFREREGAGVPGASNADYHGRPRTELN